MAARMLKFNSAVLEAIEEEMSSDPSIYFIGEDARYGVFKETSALVKRFNNRILNAPISEAAIVGSAVGAAVVGMRPIIDLTFNDLLFRAMDEVANQAAKFRYSSGGQARLCMVILVDVLTGLGNGVHHSQSLEALFMHIPGLYIAAPSNPADAKGLLKSAIRGSTPVLFFQHAYLFGEKGPIPDGDHLVPLGKARIVREGTDATIISFSYMAKVATRAAEELEKDGIQCEVIDLRTIVPLDKTTIVESVKKTGKLVTCEMGCRTGGIGAELAAQIWEEAFDFLDGPLRRVAAEDCPVPYSPALQKHILPDQDDIVAAVRDVVG